MSILPRTEANDLHAAQVVWDAAEGWLSGTAAYWPVDLKDVVRYLKSEPLQESANSDAYPEQPPAPSGGVTGWLAPVAGLYVSGYPFQAGHLAVDFASAAEATPSILCPSPGVVTYSGTDNRYAWSDISNAKYNRGVYVEITHDDGYRSRWCHLAQNSAHYEGRIEQGASLGIMGQTGYATGVHCHCSVIDPAGVAIDPMTMWS